MTMCVCFAAVEEDVASDQVFFSTDSKISWTKVCGCRFVHFLILANQQHLFPTNKSRCNTNTKTAVSFSQGANKARTVKHTIQLGKQP